jgi:lantibiotic biosynthesis protein
MTPEQILKTADSLANPAADHLPHTADWWRQSLAHGVPGIALLHTELAAAGLRPWSRVRAWLSAAASAPITGGSSSTGLFYGAPALAFAMAAVAEVRPGAYRAALEQLDAQIAADARRRVADAHARIDSGALPALAEFDTLRGLAGIGAYLLRRCTHVEELCAVLEVLARSTRPLADADGPVPGWWTASGPSGRADQEYPGGHGNAGLAHGIAGPLALLALAVIQGVTVPGQTEAIAAVGNWLDSWCVPTDCGDRWPYLVTRSELTSRPNEVLHSGAKRRPSWCYGTAGLARVQQLAAVAVADPPRRRAAETALTGALTDPAQLAATVDDSLCHGHAGLSRIASRAATDAAPATAVRLNHIADALAATLTPAAPTGTGAGLLEGAAGTVLAALGAPATRWDTCLLIA